MVFNVHVTPIGEKQASNQSPSQMSRGIVQTAKQQPLVNVPADKSINKYPVRIFDLQPQP